MSYNIQIIEKQKELSQYCAFILESFSLIIFIEENMGFKKCRFYSKNCDELDNLTLEDLIKNQENARFILR